MNGKFGRRIRPATGMLAALVLAALVISGCSATGSGGNPSGGSSSSAGVSGKALDDLKAKVAKYETEPTEILAKSLGSFTPKSGGYLYYITCDLSIVGCHAIADAVEAGTKAIGYKFSMCDAGTTSDKANKCFTNAINAKPDVIIVGGNGVSVAGAGYAAAKTAGIPMVGLFTSNPEGTTTSEVANQACVTEGDIMAAAVIVRSDGNPNALYVGESSQACDANRTKAFSESYQKYCPSCAFKDLEFDYPTVQQTLPNQIQSALVQDPKINWIVGVFDQAASIAVTQLQQTGKENSVSVAGMDGNPPNVQLIRQGSSQKLDFAVGQGEDGWSAVDAAARIYSGQKVPFDYPVNTFLITPENVKQIDTTSNTWPGPKDYESQFKKLWGLG